ncbi:MAG: sugar-binding domain-containing protein, partial [Candidatus Cryptobacteroides sp.]
MTSKLIIALLATFFAAFPLRAQITFGQPEKINEGWKFALNPGEDCSPVDYDDSGWRTLDLPHDWSVEFPISNKYASCTGYLPGGEGWYRKNLFVPASEKGRRLYLYFEGIYNNSEVWVNGERVGYRPNGYVSFIYDVTGKL